MTIAPTAVELNNATSLAAPQTAIPSVQTQPSAKSQTTATTNQSSTKEDTVSLSVAALRALTYPPTRPSPVPPTFDQIVHQAADGDIRALAQLALL
jgi:hypothetical protein